MTWLLGVRAWAGVCAVAALFCACGSKSGLLEARGNASPDAGAGASGGSAGNGGAGGAGGGGAAGGSGPVDAGPPPPCRLEVAGEPREVLSFPEGEAGNPDLAIVESGAPDRPARVALLLNSEEANFWHPELRVAELAIGATWPDVTTTHAPVLWGFDAHAGGTMSAAAGAPGLALAFYHADEASPTVVPGFKFRPFNVTSWAPGAETYIDPTGVSGYELAAGDGYAVTYAGGFDDGSWEPRVALLDAAGSVVLGPLALAPAGQYPGAGATIAWTGSAYLAAVSYGDCAPGGAPCAPRAIGVVRVAAETGSVELVSSVPYLSASSIARRPSIASHAGNTWIVWREAEDSETIESWVVRAVRVTPEGALASSVIEIAKEARPVNGVSLHVSNVGVIVGFGQVRPEMAPPTTPGHTSLLFHHLDFDGSPIQEPIDVAITQLGFDPPHALATLDHPRSVLAAWCGEPVGVDEPSVAYLLRLDCVD